MTENSLSTGPQNMLGGCEANEPRQTNAHGVNGGSGDSGNAWLNTPEAIAGRRTLKEVLIDGYCNGLYSHDLVDRHFERYRLREI